MMTTDNPFEGLPFDGVAYNHERDNVRLSGQCQRVFDVMKDGQWRSLQELAKAAEAPEASVSAQLRHLRKKRFGCHTVSRRHIEGGLHVYRLEASA